MLCTIVFNIFPGVNLFKTNRRINIDWVPYVDPCNGWHVQKKAGGDAATCDHTQPATAKGLTTLAAADVATALDAARTECPRLRGVFVGGEICPVAFDNAAQQCKATRWLDLTSVFFEELSAGLGC